MRDNLRFFIGGDWVEPSGQRVIDVINPADESVVGTVALGDATDVDRAVAAAKSAFETFSVSSTEERIALFDRIIAAYQARMPDLAKAVTAEMGAPAWMSEQLQVTSGLANFQIARGALAQYQFDRSAGTTEVVREAAGVCALITAWNWPLMLISSKIAPALAAGCTMILKPSEIAPFSATIIAEILEAAGVPAGVFNLVHGDGQVVGNALSRHPDVDLVSFTGSTRAGIEVARTSADTVKRVHQELGGKSPNVILPSADLRAAVEGNIGGIMLNSGQSCNAPSRMLVHESQLDEVIALARTAAEGWTVGDPASDVRMGPVASQAQYDKIQSLIQSGIDEGATLVTGGPGKPEGLDKGYYVRPTVFAHVTNEMTIAREEIFGPVLVIIAYADEDEAVRIANDTVYGLAGYVQGEPEAARAIARKLRAGQITLNNAGMDLTAPFGGYKQSGNGREWGETAFAEFLETKAIVGFRDAA